MSDQFSVAGRVAVVTGGLGQLGTQFTKSLAEAGAKVAVYSRRPFSREQVAEKWPGLEENIRVYVADVTDKEALDGFQVVMPVAIDRHDKINVRTFRQLPADIGSDLLQHLATVANDDPVERDDLLPRQTDASSTSSRDPGLAGAPLPSCEQRLAHRTRCPPSPQSSTE